MRHGVNTTPVTLATHYRLSENYGMPVDSVTACRRVQHMDNTTNIDWSRIISDLLESWTVQQVADRCGLSASAVYDIGSGRTREPRGMAAVRLHELHKQLPVRL